MQWPLVQMPGFSEHSSTSETQHHSSSPVIISHECVQMKIESVILTHSRLIQIQTLPWSETQRCEPLWNTTYAHDHRSTAGITCVRVCAYTVLTLILSWADLTGVTPPLTRHSTTATQSFSCVERLRCQTASVLKLSVTIIHTNICVSVCVCVQERERKYLCLYTVSYTSCHQLKTKALYIKIFFTF